MTTTEKETHIHKTEFVEKELPTIIIQTQERHGTFDIKTSYIKVSDKTSNDALKTLEKIQKSIK